MHSGSKSQCRGGGRGGGQGRGGGRGGSGFRSRIEKDTTTVLCLGNGHGTLVPYSGHFDDSRLANYSRFQIGSTCVRDEVSVSVSDQLLEPQYEELFKKASSPDVHWKAQFGTQIVYFGHAKGLPATDASKYAGRVLSEGSLTKLIDGQSRSSFATHELSDCASVVARIQEKIDAQVASHKYILRCTEKAANYAVMCYDNEAETRQALLSNHEFTAESFYDETRCGNFVFVLPATGEEQSAEDYLLFRVHVVKPKQPTGRARRVRVNVNDVAVSAHFIGDTSESDYTRIQDRYVLHVNNSPFEIHVMDNEEFGSKVTQRGAKVRVELHCAPQRPSRADWENFVVFAADLARILPVLSYTAPFRASEV